MRLLISADVTEFASNDDLWEWEPNDSEDIAESMDEVRGIMRWAARPAAFLGMEGQAVGEPDCLIVSGNERDSPLAEVSGEAAPCPGSDGGFVTSVVTEGPEESDPDRCAPGESANVGPDRLRSTGELAMAELGES